MIYILHIFLCQSGCEIYEISMRRGYGLSNFRDDLKVLFNRIGIDDKKTAFIFSAAQVKLLRYIKYKLLVKKTKASYVSFVKLQAINMYTKKVSTEHFFFVDI